MMEILRELQPPSLVKKNRLLGLTIGSFDGVHLGHQYLINELRNQVGAKGIACILTFSNHPTQVLPHLKEIPQIYTEHQKLKALASSGVDLVYSLSFTLELAKLPYDVFLSKLQKTYPFSILVQGSDTSFGKDRAGTPEKIQHLGKKWSFSTTYIDKIEKDEWKISSGKIRTAIQEGNFEKVTQLLGRPYAIEGEGLGSMILFPPFLCLPPNGKYDVYILTHKGKHKEKISIQGHRAICSTSHKGSVTIELDPR